MNAAELAVPRAIRVAGVLVMVQGLAGVAAATEVIVSAMGESTGPVPAVATAAWLAVLGVFVLAVGAYLARGRHGARTPAIVTQILLLGASWYAAGPSSRPALGVPAAVFCVAVLVLLFCPPSIRWAIGQDRTARRRPDPG
ncbi:MAG: hypothetical protein ACRDSH_07325 [Pseudonocardiaceae bacterium]